MTEEKSGVLFLVDVLVNGELESIAAIVAESPSHALQRLRESSRIKYDIPSAELRLRNGDIGYGTKLGNYVFIDIK